ncbi:MAG: arginine--tRNA ligase [Candidatus Micrarchaeia archaeon]
MLKKLEEELSSILGSKIEIELNTKYADACSNFAIKNRLNAKEICSKINQKQKKFFSRAEELNNYINLFFDYKNVFLEMLKESLEEGKEEKEKQKKKEKVIVEYPSVNPNKPWHIGHLRNALLGDVISRLFLKNGYEVERINYIDDLGLQVAINVFDYLKNKEVKEDKKFDHFAGERYVEAYKQYEEKEEVKKEVEEIMKKMEEGNNEVAYKAKEFAKNCVLAQYETSFNYSIFNDLLVWESDIAREKLLQKALEIGKQKGIFFEGSGENKNCLVAKVFGKEKILVRSNGVATYFAKDIAFHFWKFGILENVFNYEKFLKQPNGEVLYSTSQKGEKMDFGKARMSINIVGSEQKEEQEAVREVIKKFDEQAEVVHVAYEEVRLKEERFSGRKGTWITYTADELLEEAKKRALEQIRKRFEMSEEEKQKVARVIAVGGIKFEILRSAPNKKFIFSWDKAINFEGDSFAYICYSYARAMRIIEKYMQEEKEIKLDFSKYEINEEEKELIKNILLIEKSEEEAFKNFKPNLICEQLLKTASSFASFYEKHKVLKAKEEEKNFRIALVFLYSKKIKEALSILGIEVVERM